MAAIGMFTTLARCWRQVGRPHPKPANVATEDHRAVLFAPFAAFRQCTASAVKEFSGDFAWLTQGNRQNRAEPGHISATNYGGHAKY